MKLANEPKSAIPPAVRAGRNSSAAIETPVVTPPVW